MIPLYPTYWLAINFKCLFFFFVAVFKLCFLTLFVFYVLCSLCVLLKKFSLYNRILSLLRVLLFSQFIYYFLQLLQCENINRRAIRNGCYKKTSFLLFNLHRIILSGMKSYWSIPSTDKKKPVHNQLSTARTKSVFHRVKPIYTEFCMQICAQEV